MSVKPENPKSKHVYKRQSERCSTSDKHGVRKKKNLKELELSSYEGQRCSDKSTVDIVELITSQMPDRKLQGLKALRKLLVKDLSQGFIDEVIDLELIPKVVECLRDESEVAQFEAAWVITNLATGDTRQTRYLIEGGAVDKLISHLYSPGVAVQEQAAWALGNIAGDSPEFRDFILEKGGADAAIHALKSADKLPLLQTTTWLFSILCKGAKTLNSLAPAIPILRELLKQEDTDLVSQCCWSLASLSQSTDGISQLLDHNVPPYLVQLLTRQNQIVEPALQVIGNIVTGDELPTQIMIDCGVLPHTVRLLESSSYTIRKEVCWILSNILAGTKRQIQAVLDVNPLPAMMYLLSKDGIKTKKEIVWAFRNITIGGTNEQIKFLAGQGAVDKLCSSLTVANNEVIQVSLRVLEVILELGEAESSVKGSVNGMAVAVEECKGIEALETLLSHSSPDIYRKAYEIMEKYFGTME